MTDITAYIKQFASLNRAPGATWSDATRCKAPHKPLLLLAVLDLVHRGVITAPFIAVTGDLVELNELFNLLLAADHPPGPDQQYRRIVVKAYDHRCALCGVRIITPEQHTVVDAAHIVPWCRSQNDDILNGMALCKPCHWAFDEEMMGVSDSYAVITSLQIAANPNVPGFLLTLSGRSIIPPSDRDLWPAQHYLVEHRREWRL